MTRQDDYRAAVRELKEAADQMETTRTRYWSAQTRYQKAEVEVRDAAEAFLNEIAPRD